MRFLLILALSFLIGPLANANNLWTAVRTGNTEQLRDLLEDGQNPNVLNSDYKTLLWTAVRLNSDLEIIELLLKHGADPSLDNKDGSTAVDLAVSRANIELYKLFMLYGVTPSAHDLVMLSRGYDHPEFGYPGSSAPIDQRVEMVKLMLANGADPTESSRWQPSAVDVARDNNQAAISALYHTYSQLSKTPQTFKERVLDKFKKSRGLDEVMRQITNSKFYEMGVLSDKDISQLTTYDLPEELWQYIGSFMRLKPELRNLAMTNKAMYKVLLRPRITRGMLQHLSLAHMIEIMQANGDEDIPELYTWEDLLEANDLQ